ncbi:CoA ester lyase [Vineibacter terrae]|uniref:HpcH/HpaI aldolase/citrate lyase family protein n=1 Tax=Vineibacter terrae TaxID=2586908 RepID=UPI002E375375|nr:CoA ester lyase [Vineibacter terrae]HEX2890256.1 CoA ester lyase [Vineibacter terrae]
MKAEKDLPVWRSLLYVPVNVEKFVDKAHTRGADVVQLDLEDSVPPAEKARARTLVEAAASRVSRGGADVVVRINRPLQMAVRDLEAAVCPGVHGIAVTKVEGPDHIRLLDELVSELEQQRGLAPGHTKFIAMIETPRSYFDMPAIAAACERLVAMSIGGEDFASEVGMEPTEETLLLPKQTMIYAARSAGLMPFGYIASVAGFGDQDGFRRMVRRSRQFGFMGASCIHPGQVAIVNEAYTPSAEEVAYARRIIEEDRKQAASGRGSFAVDGKMIDIPVIRRAETLLRRHDAIIAREARKQAAAG